MFRFSPNRSPQPVSNAVWRLTPRRVLVFAAALTFLAVFPCAHGQISLTTAVSLALRTNPRVLGAQDDVKKAKAQVSQAEDAYVPAVNAGAGIGQAYGYLPNPPTLFTVNAGSVVFNASQIYYIHSAKAGVNAAELSLADVRQQVAEDAALAFIALDHDQQRLQAIQQQLSYADALVTIVQQRLDAGQDSQIDLTQAQLTAAQLRFGSLKAQDDATDDREHLARLINLPPDSLQIDNSFPSNPVPLDAVANATPKGYASASVASIFASAEARQQQALGDARFRFWPEINLVVQYNRYATFTNSFKTIEALNNQNSGTHIGADEAVFGVQITMPFFDKGRSAKARQSAAEASRALHDAQNAQIEALDNQGHLRHSIDELKAQAEVARLKQQLAQQQLDVLHVQLQNGTGNPNGPQMSPKDEQTARITERDRYLDVIDANYQVRQGEIQLMRQSDSLESWLNSVVEAAPSSTIQKSVPPTPAPQP